MAYYCINTEPYVDKNFPTDRKWVVITKDYPKPSPKDGKKKITKEQNEEYLKMIDKRSKMFKQLESGHYNCFNQPAEGDSIFNCASNIVGSDCNYVFYRVNPTSCKVTSERYSCSMHHYLIYEFDVVNKCDTTEELLLQLSKDGYLNEFLARAFEYGHCTNRQDAYKKVLQFCKNNTKEHNFCVGDIVAKNNYDYKYDRVPRFGTDKYDLIIEDFVKELISDGLMLLHSWLDFYEKQTFTFLLRMHWFDIALDYIKSIEQNNLDPLREEVIGDKSFKDIERILKTNNEKESVKEIIKLLNFKPSTLTLKVYPYVTKWDDFEESEEPTEVKDFENIDNVKAYLVTKYKVPFSKLTGDVSDFEHRAGEYEITHFIVE